jgi:hypothetical protein
MRPRKPGDAAQPGEAIPVLVAARFLKRRRVPNPMEGRLYRNRPFAARSRRRQSARVDSERQKNGMRGWRSVTRSSAPAHRPKTTEFEAF